MILTLLLESAVRSLGLGIVVGIGLKLFRLRPPAAQRIVWTVVLVSAVLMPLLMQWRAVRVPAPVTALDWIALSAAPAGNGASGARVPPYAAAVPSAIRDWAAIAVDAYVLVACALLLRLMTGLLLTFRLLRTAEVDTEVEDLDVRVSANVSAPVSFGPAILVPQAWLNWDTLTRRAVLSHERSHIERGDFYFQLLASLHRAAFWFSPLGWWLHKRLSELGELESDDAAMSEIQDRAKYAEILVEMAARPTSYSFAGVSMARPATVAGRIDRILAGDAVGTSLGRLKRAALVLCVIPLVGLIAGSCLRSQAQPSQAAAAPRVAAPSPALPAPSPVRPRQNRNPFTTADNGSIEFALVTADSKSVYGSQEDARRVELLRSTIPGDFIWFRQDSKNYVVTDPQIVQRAKDIIRPIEMAQAELGRQQAELGDQQAALGLQQARLGEQQANVTVAVPDLTGALDELRTRLDGITGKNLRQDEIGDLQARIGNLQARVGDLQARAGDQQARIGQEQAKLGEQQAALGARQADFGRQQADKAEEAVDKIRSLIDEIQLDGKARPVQ